MPTSLATCLSGRLGNHLFIISAAVVAARQARCPLYLYTSKLDDAPYSCRHVKDAMNRIGLQVFISDNDCCILPHTLTTKEQGACTLDSIQVRPDKNNLMNGCRQHYKYFCKYNDWILKDIFCVPARREVVLRDFGLPSLANKIVLHVRRGDYAADKHLYSILPVASDQYYVQALTQAAQDSGLTEAVLFCEEQSREDIRKTLLPTLQQFVPQVSITLASTLTNPKKPHQGWHEMLWMSSASTFVIPNSSFGWWAAWMSAASKDKLVYLPKEWFGFACREPAKEMALPDEAEGFGRWKALSNRKQSEDAVLCKFGSDFAARMCSVAEKYEQAEYEEATCGPMDRDFTFKRDTGRGVCPPSFCVLDVTDEPLVSVSGGFQFATFTSVPEFIKNRGTVKWVAFRLSKEVTLDHIFNIAWYLMQPNRFRIDMRKAGMKRFGLELILLRNMYYFVTADSIVTSQVPLIQWWDNRPMHYIDTHDDFASGCNK